MPLILAIEPDKRQAAHITPMARLEPPARQEAVLAHSPVYDAIEPDEMAAFVSEVPIAIEAQPVVEEVVHVEAPAHTLPSLDEAFPILEGAMRDIEMVDTAD